MNLNDCICKYAKETPDQLAIVTPTEQITYAELWKQITTTGAILERQAVNPQCPHVFRASQDIRFIVTYCAVHFNEAVAIPLEQSVPQETYNAILKETNYYRFPKGTSDLLYTSGSTGKAKGVLLSETALTTCAENFIHDHHYTSDLVFIISGPLNHIASLFKIHPTLMVGGTVCVIDGLKDINAFFEVFKKMPNRRFASFLVPASIRMILQFSRNELLEVADTIEFIETGAAPITQSDMKELASVLPNAHLYNTLGGTEIGAVCTYDFNDGKYMAGCVGKPMFHSHLEVDNEGTILISSPTLMTGYINDPEKTAQVLQDGVFRTSDRGYFDEDGNLHLLGRTDDAINVGGFKADPIEIENMVMTLDYIKDCICISAPHPIAGTCVKLLYVVKDGKDCKHKDVALYLKSKLEAYKVPTLYEKVDKINLTYNGKKDRQSYKQ